MRNLKVQSRQQYAWPEISGLAYDGDSLVIATGPTEANPTITLRYLVKHSSIDDQNSINAAENSRIIARWECDINDSIVDLHHLVDTGVSVITLAKGDIVTVRQDPLPDENAIEIVGSVDAGITAVSWSPDEESIAIATGAATLLLMTRDFDSTANITLAINDVKVSNHVSVGWGKKETQFKGRGVAKTLRDPTIPEHVDEGRLSSLDDERVTMSWRGDGQYLAMNSILETDPRRRIIRVYNREGVLESVSEPVDGLEGALSWKPTGQLLASVQRSDTGLQVVFFERNGLRHGEFNLRLSEEEAKTIGSTITLQWSTDSSILAIALSDRVQLWTMSNYYWYLKQEHHFGSALSSPVSSRLIWHPESAMQMACYDRCCLFLFRYAFIVARGSVVPPFDHGLVAVIDGQRLKITPLRFANVPPPMSLDKIDLPEPATDVCFSDTGREIRVKHISGKYTLWSCDYACEPIKRATLIDEKVVDQSLTWSSYDDSKLPDGSNVSLLANGVLVVTGPSTARISGCTSFIITDMHLILTTSNHLLKFIHLQGSGELEVPLDTPEKDERCRAVERGAKIVTVMPSVSSLVLQMPRGNLETIYPRALVLSAIRSALNKRDYKTAFTTCRTHRVDMNILHDYTPEQFMTDIGLFLKQVKKLEYIDLFLSSLSEDDVSQTLYKETLNSTRAKPILNNSTNFEQHTYTHPSKVNRICDAFLHELGKQEPPALQNIVTAHVCKQPPDLEAGLRLVSELRKQGKQPELEAAVEHICFLADVNQLYDNALGLYDLDVALLVAQQSQKDPREYLPYLQSLHDQDTLRRYFTIDNDLKRHSKALHHLHALEAFDELKVYMARHELYSTAIELHRYDSVKLTELMQLYGDYLSSQNRYKEAGIAYEFVHQYALAYEAYRSAGLWQECLATATLLSISEEELASRAGDLAACLEEAKDFQAAATVHLEYLQDLEGAARLLCKAFRFAEATRIITRRHKPELLRAVLDPGLIEASATMTEMLAEMKAQLQAQVPRIRELRQKKVEDPMAFLDGTDRGDEDIPDNLSIAPTDASTTGTFMTRYTNGSTGTLATNATRKTSRNRRREERKRAKGKKGTVYEEEYLVNSLVRLVERLNSVGDDVQRLVEGLMRRGMRERAGAVERAMLDVRELCQVSLEEVFPHSRDAKVVETEPVTDAGESSGRPWGGLGVLWDALKQSDQLPERPVIKAFERLSLL